MIIDVRSRTVILLQHAIDESNRIVSELNKAGQIGKKSVNTVFTSGEARETLGRDGKFLPISLELNLEEHVFVGELVVNILLDHNFIVNASSGVVSLRF